jgi:hypothetical protein
MKFLRGNGISDESPRFSQLVKAFREGNFDEAFEQKP